jgi:hypothetical protein
MQCHYFLPLQLGVLMDETQLPASDSSDSSQCQQCFFQVFVYLINPENQNLYPHKSDYFIQERTLIQAKRVSK